MANEPLYRSIAVAAAFSPRFHQVLAEANRVRERFQAPLSAIFVGQHNAATERKFGEAFKKLRLPADSAVLYAEGDPASAILGAARQHQIDLLIAGALEKEVILAAGDTAVPIEARCIHGSTGFAASDFVQSVEANLLVVPLETKPELEPKLPPQIAWITDVIPCNLWIIR